jgi:hypothetical protein
MFRHINFEFLVTGLSPKRKLRDRWTDTHRIHLFAHKKSTVTSKYMEVEELHYEI